jgi:hypothetical protein
VIVKEEVDGTGGVTVTAATAFIDGSTPISESDRFVKLVAVMITRVVFVTRGAMKTPVLEIVPALADQVNVALEFAIMWAVN